MTVFKVRVRIASLRNLGVLIDGICAPTLVVVDAAVASGNIVCYGAGARPAAVRRQNRTLGRLHHQFHDRQLGGGARLNHFRQKRDAKHERRPRGAQNFLEWLVEGLYKFLESIIGQHLIKRTFWFFATVFIFILTTNWLGLIPGVGTVGWGHELPTVSSSIKPLLRGANADLNMTFAMALIFFALWIVWAVQEVGPIGFLKGLFGPKGETTGFLKVLMIVVFFASGCLEIVSILFRPVSLSFRLYGNIFAGETMLETMARIKPGFGWLLPIPFYFMELLVGFVQALVFMLLSAVFTLLICQHEEAAPAAGSRAAQ